MQGYKEILFSMTLSFSCLYAMTAVHERLGRESRIEAPTQPTTINEEVTDIDLNLNWGLQAIHAPQAWRASGNHGSRDIKVAIIDTGCDLNHPELARNIWTNPGESGRDRFGKNKASNGIDDDDNGFVDDVHGWNFVSDSNALMDEHGHGTHIAGIIGAQKLNGLSSSGVAPNVSLMILKYYDAESSGETNLENTVRAIRYAIKMGAQIINYSGGGILRSRLEESVLREANEHHVLLVAAAGNEGVNSDFFHFYPADYDLPNILSVAAFDRHDQLLNLSNYGRGTVDVAAPGRNIYSTLPGNSHGFMSGTSQATAFVTGVAALLMAQDAHYRDPQVLIRHFLANGRSTEALRNRIGPGQLLDAAAVLRPPPLKVSELVR